MNIFLTRFQLKITQEFQELSVIDVIAYCFIKEINIENARLKSEFYVLNKNYEIQNEVGSTLIVKREEFIEDKKLLYAFDICEKENEYIFYHGITTNQELDNSYHNIKTNKETNKEKKYSKLLNMRKEIFDKGICLYPKKNNDCNEIINAHSIQKNGILRAIAKNQHVYSYSNNMMDYINKNKNYTCKLISINKMSVFRGFCGFHDHLLFSDIDNKNLIPTRKQIFLHSYRCIAKEIYSASKVIDMLTELLKNKDNSDIANTMYSSLKIGKQISLKNLNSIKMKYDSSIINDNYQDIEYEIFISKNKPNIAFSSQMFPDYDFDGNKIQDLMNEQLGLITFSNEVFKQGWVFIFAWHKDFNNIAEKFIKPLRKMDNHDLSLSLFKLSLIAVNRAFSPDWWDSLSITDRNTIENYSINNIDIMSVVKNNYLKLELDGITNWIFEERINSRETV